MFLNYVKNRHIQCITKKFLCKLLFGHVQILETQRSYLLIMTYEITVSFIH